MGSWCYPPGNQPAGRTLQANCPAAVQAFKVISYNLSGVAGLDTSTLTLQQWGNLCVFALNGLNNVCGWSSGDPAIGFTLNSNYYPAGWNGTTGTIEIGHDDTVFQFGTQTNSSLDIQIDTQGTCCVNMPTPSPIAVVSPVVSPPVIVLMPPAPTASALPVAAPSVTATPFY